MAKIEATGNLGANAELKFLPSGTPVLEFRFNDSKSKPNGNGGWETLKEQWLNVSLFGEAAEFYSDKLGKGARVTVWGEFYAREYDKKDGSKGVSLDIRADAVKIWPKRDGNQSAPSQAAQNVASQLGGQPDNTWGQPVQQNDPWGQPAGTQAPPF